MLCKDAKNEIILCRKGEIVLSKLEDYVKLGVVNLTKAKAGG